MNKFNKLKRPLKLCAIIGAMRMLLIPVILLAGCSTIESDTHYRGPVVRLPVGARDPQDGAFAGGGKPANGPAFERKPWEMWQQGSDFEGLALTTFGTLEGDNAFERGDRIAALASYQGAIAQVPAGAEKGALVARIAALQLTNGLPSAAVSTLSGFFQAQGGTPESVPAPYAMLFGYAYAGQDNTDQALAWFSRAYVAARPPFAHYRDIAGSAVAAVLQGVPDANMDRVSDVWASDEFVHAALGRERARRAAGGAIVTTAPWSSGTTGSVVQVAQNPGSEARVGVLLPLTGRFAALGRKVKNGLELALAVQSSNSVLKLFFADSGEGPDAARQQAQKLLSEDSVTMLVGPLLAEQAVAVRQVAERAGVALVSLSKRTDFQPQPPVFRFAVTTEQQAKSLVAAVRDRFSLSQLAIVSSDDPAAQEAAHAMRVAVAEAGIQVTLDKTFAKSDLRGAAQLGIELNQSGCQAIFFADGPPIASTIIAAIPELPRARIKLLGLTNWDNEQQLQNARTVMDGAIFVSAFFRGATKQTVQDFSKSYAQKYGEPADFLSAQGFDLGALLLAAQRSNAQGSGSFVDALTKLGQMDGLTGLVTTNASGELTRQFKVVVFQGGTFQELL